MTRQRPKRRQGQASRGSDKTRIRIRCSQCILFGFIFGIVLWISINIYQQSYIFTLPQFSDFKEKSYFIDSDKDGNFRIQNLQNQLKNNKNQNILNTNTNTNRNINHNKRGFKSSVGDIDKHHNNVNADDNGNLIIDEDIHRKTQLNANANANTISKTTNRALHLQRNPQLLLSNAHEHSHEHNSFGAPQKTNKPKLSEYCPLRRNLCLRDGHWVTPHKSDTFNLTELMFGTGIHSKYKTYRDRMYAVYDEHLLQHQQQQRCTFIPANESLIILHSWYPHMLWETMVRIATPLFQYQVFEQFLSKEHRFAIMQLEQYDLSPIHDLLLSPFTNYPFVHLQSLMDNQTQSLYEYGINLDIKYYSVLEYPSRMKQYTSQHEHEHQQENDAAKPHTSQNCLCFAEIFWCGFNQEMTKSVKQLPTVFDGIGSHEFGIFAWDMARFYKKYIRTTYGKIPIALIRQKTKPRILFIQRRTWRRPWDDINATVADCRASQSYFDCFVIYFEDFTHIESIWNMQLSDILIGIHGSGLVNALFMSELSTVLEIIPYRAPDYAPHSGTIMQWIFERSPQRHAWMPLLANEQEHHWLRDWQKPFNLSWQRIQPAIEYLSETPHDFCTKSRVIPKHLKQVEFKIGEKSFSKKSPLYPYRPKCKDFAFLTM